jgi:hypothetical protein
MPVIGLSAHALAGEREKRSRPDVKSSIPSRWSLIGCWAKFVKLREA